MSESLQYKCCRFPITTSSKSLSPRVSSPYISKSQQWRVRLNQFKPCPLHFATSVRRHPKACPFGYKQPSAMCKRNTSHVHSVVPTRSCLTSHSTGPIAARRHLGYKSLAQMPPRHNGPVSSNVRRRWRRSRTSFAENTSLTKPNTTSNLVLIQIPIQPASYRQA